MGLANEITYDGKLECVSEMVAQRKIKMNEKFTSLKSSILVSENFSKIFTNSIIFIDTSEIMKSFTSSNTDANENRISNKTEVEIVYNLCKIFYKVFLFKQ